LRVAELVSPLQSAFQNEGEGGHENAKVQGKALEMHAVVIPHASKLKTQEMLHHAHFQHCSMAFWNQLRA
jgi:hypothetical protein